MMPFVNEIYQPDQASPLDRLYGFQKRQADIKALQDQQNLIDQRKQVLAQSYAPATAARTEYDITSNPIANLFGIQQQAPANLVQRSQTTAPQEDGSSLIPGLGSPKQIPGTPASFDRQGAVNRLYSIGDLEGAEKLVNDQYKQLLSARGGLETFGTGGDIVRGADGKLYKQQYSNRGGTKLIPLDGEKLGSLQKMDLGGKQVLINPYTGEVVSESQVTSTPYQQFQMNPDRQAAVAGAEAEARAQGEAAGKQASAAPAAAEQTQAALTTLDRLMKSPGLKSATGISSLLPVVPGSDRANFLADLDAFKAQTFLPMVQYMKGTGALTEAEGKKLTDAVGALDPSRMSDVAMLDSMKRIYSDLLNKRSSLMSKKESARPSGQTAPTSNGQMNSLPAAAQYPGRTIRDTSTGLTYKSDGKQWMRVK